MAKVNSGGSRGRSTVQAVTELVRPYSDELGLILWDVKFVKEGASWYLRIIIDKDDGVLIDDCEALSRAIDKPLDDADLIDRSYCLEVSSPGIGRELCRPEHFEAMLGCDISIVLIRPIDNKREFIGELISYDGGDVTVEIDGESITFEKGKISKVTLYEPF